MHLSITAVISSIIVTKAGVDLPGGRRLRRATWIEKFPSSQNYRHHHMHTSLDETVTDCSFQQSVLKMLIKQLTFSGL